MPGPANPSSWSSGSAERVLTALDRLPGRARPLPPQLPHQSRQRGAASAITIEAEVVPKGMFGSHVAEPRLERAHFVVPHHEVRALERDLTMIAQAAQELGDHEVVPHLLAIVEAAFAIYGPAWPSASDTAVSRLALGYVNPIGSGVASVPPSYAVEAYDVHPYSMPIWHLPPPPRPLEPLPAAALDAVRTARTEVAQRLERLKAGLSPGRPARAHRPRPHRPGLALAGGGDAAQGPPHLLHRARPDGALPRFHLQPVIGAALRLDRGGRPRPLRADQGARRRGPLGADRRLVGRAGLHRSPAARRSSASSSTVSATSQPGSANARPSPGCRMSSDSRAGSPSSCAAPGSTASSRSSSTGTKPTSFPTTSSPGKGSTAAG